MGRRSKLIVSACILASALTWPAVGARAETCEGLWYSRNAIYKSAGYCFRTARGIQAFGNAGCLYDDVNDVPLSTQQRRIIADIQRQEDVGGCR